MKIIVDIAGGLGNQLFCYAFGYAVSKEIGADLIVDTSMQDNGIARELSLNKYCVEYKKRISYMYRKSLLDRALFNKIRKKLSIGFKTKLYQEDNSTKYDANVFSVTSDTYFKGNWQSEKYFEKYRAELLTLFKLKRDASSDMHLLTEKMKSENSIAIHVRRGDYVRIGCNLNMDFYKDALAMIVKMGIYKPVLYIFSDDREFCKEYFSRYESEFDIIYPEYEGVDDITDDLYLMSKCKHMIMANSSYSWWAAWLNQNTDKIVICPELDMWTGDFYPESWIKIKVD